MGGVAAAHRGGDPQRAARLHLLDVDRLAAVEHRQVAGLPRLAHEPLEERQRLVPQVHLLQHQAAQLEDAKPQPVAGGAGVALDQPPRLQVHQEAVDGRLVQPQPLGQLGHAELRRFRGEGVQDRHRALDGLDPVPRPGRALGDRRGHLVHPVSHRGLMSRDNALVQKYH